MARKVLMVTEVSCDWSRMATFNAQWTRENLPFWTSNGARYVGSYESYLGEGKHKTMRLFEFDDLNGFNAFMERREAMFETETGAKTLERIYPFVETIRETVWKAV